MPSSACENAIARNEARDSVHQLFSIPDISHIIFSTKNREPSLGLDMRPRMHAYLATVCCDLGAEVVRVGGSLITSHCYHAAANYFPSSIDRADKENVLKSLPSASPPLPASGERIEVRGIRTFRKTR